MSASLVGSEMCIRDRDSLKGALQSPLGATPRRAPYLLVGELRQCEPVSYTHLTLPTICSV
eukprot:6604850-Alexandrium_andersonii.AAC.1